MAKSQVKLHKMNLSGYKDKFVSIICSVTISVSLFFYADTVLSNEINTPDINGDVGRYSSLALDSTGLPVIAYHDLTQRNLKILFCDDRACSGDESENMMVADNNRMVGTYISLLLDSQSLPVVSYYDSLNGSLKLLKCLDKRCKKFSVSVPDVSPGVGKYASMVLDKDGKPIVSYYDVSNGNLKLLYCDDRACLGDESKNIVVLDAAGDVGLYSSLALDRSGNPVVTYFASDVGLKILWCDDPKCSDDESDNIIILDHGQVGWDTSLSINQEDIPLVLYQDFSNQTLKVASCNTSRCQDEKSTVNRGLSVPGKASYPSLYVDEQSALISYHDLTDGKFKLLVCKDHDCMNQPVSEIVIDEDHGSGLYSDIAIDSSNKPAFSYYNFKKGNLKFLRCLNPECK